MNPAPTLLDEWLTWPFVIGVVCVVVLVWLVLRWDEAGRELDRVLEEGPPQAPFVYDDLCAIEFCNRYASTQFPGSKGALLVCRYHAGWVSEWTGPAEPFDQERDAS